MKHTAPKPFNFHPETIKEIEALSNVKTDQALIKIALNSSIQLNHYFDTWATKLCRMADLHLEAENNLQTGEVATENLSINSLNIKILRSRNIIRNQPFFDNENSK